MPVPAGINEIAPKNIEENPKTVVNMKSKFKLNDWKHRKIPTASKNHVAILTTQLAKRFLFDESKRIELLNSEELTLSEAKNFTLLSFSCKA